MIISKISDSVFRFHFGRQELLATFAAIAFVGACVPFLTENPQQEEHRGSFTAVYYLNQNLAYASTHKGFVLKTTNGGQTWIKVYDLNHFINDIIFPDSMIGYALGNDGLIFKTTNQGKEWARLNSGTQERMQAGFFFDKDTGFCAGGSNGTYATILMTKDGGSTWSHYVNQELMPGLMDIFFPTRRIGYAVGIDGGRFKTTNGGESWFRIPTSQLHPFLSQDHNVVHFIDSITGFVGGELTLYNGTHNYRNSMVKTTNGGVTWDLQNTQLTTGHFNAIHFFDRETGLAAGWWGGMTRTTDGGANWMPVSIDSGFTENIIALDFANPEKGRFFTESGHTYISADSGKTWSPL